MVSVTQVAKRNIIIILLVLGVFVGGAYTNELGDFVLKNYGFLGWIFGSVVPAVFLVYHKNRKAYLWVQRNIFLPFRRTHSEWRFLGMFTTKEFSDFENATRILKEKYSGSYKVTHEFTNKLEMVVADKISYTLEVETSELENCRITFKSGYELVPSYDYENHLKEITYLMNEVERSLKGRVDSNFSITIKFIEKNPYFGFLLQNLPQDCVKDFRINISLPVGGQTVLNADKEKLIVNASDALSLQKATIDYLSFSPSITG